MQFSSPNNYDEILKFFPYKPKIKKIGSFSIGFLKIVYDLQDFNQRIVNVIFDSEHLLAYLLNKKYEVFKILELDEFIEENDDSILLRDEYFCWDVVNNCLEIMYKLPHYKLRITNSARGQYSQPKLQLRKASCQLSNEIVKNIIWDQFISQNYKKNVRRQKIKYMQIENEITKEDEEQFKALKQQIKEEQSVPKQLTFNEISKMAQGLFYFGFDNYEEANRHGIIFDFKKKEFVRFYRNDVNLKKFTPEI